MARITCPYCKGKAGRWSTGDGYEEWDECKCCNPNGDNNTGKVSARRLRQFEKSEAEEAARWERLAAEYEAEMAALDREYGPEHVW